MTQGIWPKTLAMNLLYMPQSVIMNVIKVQVFNSEPMIYFKKKIETCRVPIRRRQFGSVSIVDTPHLLLLRIVSHPFFIIIIIYFADRSSRRLDATSKETYRI